MESAMLCVSIMKLLNEYNERKTFKLKATLIQLLKENNIKHRIKDFMLIQALYNDIDYRSHFRLTRSSVEVSYFY